MPPLVVVMMSKRMLIYICQFESYWRLSYKEAIRFLEDAIGGKPWDLDDYGKRLSRTPPNLYTKPNQFLFKPLDMEEDTLRATLEELKQKRARL